MEVWKDIPGVEGKYQASSLGQIRSLDRVSVDRMGRVCPHSGKVLLQNSDKDGYRTVNIFTTKHLKQRVHRLVAAAFFGVSKLQVDHKNGDKGDNRVENLEYVTTRENQLRLKERIGTKSGLRGASWHKQNQKWQSEIRINNVRHYLGTFETQEQAAKAYEIAKQEKGAA